MIAGLRGVVIEKGPLEAIVDVSGVWYRVAVSTMASARLPGLGAEVTLRVRTVVREDAFDLYGFLSKTEEELFLLLTSVSQVGPKMALNVLSGLEASELIAALSRGEVARLTKIHGVGRKTAERLVLELKDKVKLLSPDEGAVGVSPVSSGAADELASALINLGYKPAQAESAVRAVSERLDAEAGFEARFREALKVLRSG